MPKDISKTAIQPCMAIMSSECCLKNALVTFLDLMNRVFKPYLDEFVVIFINDILVKSKDNDEHTTHLSTVLYTLREHQLYGKLKQCEFWLEEVVFFRHVFTRKLLRLNPKR